MTGLPLEGIRVIEFGAGVVVPHLTQQLADFGADVVIVESKFRPGGMRGASSGSIEQSVAFAMCARNKRSASINLRTKKGVEIAKRLVQASDIVAENFSLGVMKRLGLDYSSLKELKPDIIMISLQGMGTSGPYKDFVTWGPEILAFSGMTHLWNHPDSPVPVGSQIWHPDYFAGIMGAVAVLAALDHRARTGEGQFIELAQIEAAASLLGTAFLDYTTNGRVQQPVGNGSPYAAPHGCYRCEGEDKWCVIAVSSDEEWQRFSRAIGSPAWTKDPRFDSQIDRVKNANELDRLVEGWTINYSSEEVMKILQEAGVAAGAVQSAEDLLMKDNHIKERGFFVELDHPELGKVAYPGLPARLSATPASVRSRAPLLGEHTQSVLSEILGLSEDEVAELAEQGVLV